VNKYLFNLQVTTIIKATINSKYNFSQPKIIMKRKYS